MLIDSWKKVLGKFPKALPSSTLEPPTNNWSYLKKSRTWIPWKFIEKYVVISEGQKILLRVASIDLKPAIDEVTREELKREDIKSIPVTMWSS